MTQSNNISTDTLDRVQQMGLTMLHAKHTTSHISLTDYQRLLLCCVVLPTGLEA